MLTGYWLRSNRPGNHKAAGLALAGLISLSVGYAWGQVFPIIRLLWTSSMVLFTAGLSLLLLALFYWLIDVRGYKKWAFFFIVIGANPITIFVLQSIVDFNNRQALRHRHYSICRVSQAACFAARCPGVQMAAFVVYVSAQDIP
ncbi:MAG: hypothetical protein ACYSW7_10880 [Planctomycetota bacterium]